MEEKYGEVEEMNVCDNLGDHLVGNVYVKVGAHLKASPVSITVVLFSQQKSRASVFQFQPHLSYLSLDGPLQFRYEEDAEKAVIDLNNRWFNGQPIHAELSPVTDFREACCRQYEMGSVLHDGITAIHF